MFPCKKQVLLFTVLIALVSGCASMLPTPKATYSWQSDPEYSSIDNEFFTAEISRTFCGPNGCKAFRLTIKNKTNKNLELDWNKTLYISNGQTSGGFMFEGVVYKDRNNSKPPDIIFAGDEFSKDILPNNLVYFSNNKYNMGWKHRPMPAGENGVFLTIVVDGKEISGKSTMSLFKTRK